MCKMKRGRRDDSGTRFVVRNENFSGGEKEK